MQESQPVFLIPWENGRAFLPTIRDSIIHPYAFANRFPGGDVKPAVTYCLLVQLFSIVASAGASAVRKGQMLELIDAVGRETEKALWLFGLTLMLAVLVHSIVRHARNDSHLSDAVRIAAYSLAVYTVLRLAVLPLFVFKLEGTRVGGTIAFALWTGPIAFSALFMVVAVRHRYQRSLTRSIFSVVGATLVLLLAIAVTTSVFR